MIHARALMLIAMILGGCLVDSASRLPEDFSVCSEPAASEEETSEPWTYYQDTKPVIDARCASCHVEGGIAPFSLTTFDDVFRNRDAFRLAIALGTMPPWDASECCRAYEHERSLSSPQKQMLLEWIDQGSPAGDESMPGAPLEEDSGGLSRVDLEITMLEPFVPRAVVGNDEVRCFVLDWPLEEQTYVTGINVIPGNYEVVHHVSAFTVSDGAAEDLRSREGEDGRPGFDCWGSLGNELPTAAIGGWTPGESGNDFPAGLGRKIPGGGAVLLQIHYDTSSRSTAPDQTSLQLKIDSSVEREAKTVPVGNPQWLIGDGLFIAANEADAMYHFAYDPTVVLGRGKAIELFSATIHMHDYGSAGRVAVLRADGTVECLLSVDDYDFSWHGEVFFSDPVVLEPGDQIYVECHFDNTRGNQKLIDGELESPRDLHWGTDQEMCGALLMTAEAR